MVGEWGTPGSGLPPVTESVVAAVREGRRRARLVNALAARQRHAGCQIRDRVTVPATAGHLPFERILGLSFACRRRCR